MGKEKGRSRWGGLFAKINEALAKKLETIQVSINRIMTKQMIACFPNGMVFSDQEEDPWAHGAAWMNPRCVY